MVGKKKTSQLTYSRPPVVGVLGHVDHGKTTLLSAIREIDLTAKEAGGITQHIGAYQIKYKKEKITFIDTPGHAAFVKMRSQGASVTDLVVLVIAADAGVQPQTKECLAHIKKAKVPFLVVINKIDLPQASGEMVKAQLAKNDVLVEGYGGNIVCVEVSAKQKKGIDELLEMILLIAKMQNLEAHPQQPLEGVVIDSRLDSRQGPLATVLVRKGTLSRGEQISAAEIKGKARAMFDENGQSVKQATVSKPVVVLGFKEVPLVGARVKQSLAQGKLARRQAGKIKKEMKEELVKGKIKIILKADTSGTMEAIQANLSQEVEIIFAGVGQVNESDVLLAQTTGAQIIAFNVKTPSAVKKLAAMETIEIKTYNIIYKLLEDLEKRVLKILEPTIDEEILGEAEIIAEFNIKGNHIAGCRLTKGKINKKDKLHLKRKTKLFAEAKIKSFQQEKKEISEAKAGDEVGIVFTSEIDFKIGDVIIAYN
jgi:translation initiation factor IF-2